MQHSPHRTEHRPAKAPSAEGGAPARRMAEKWIWRAKTAGILAGLTILAAAEHFLTALIGNLLAQTELGEQLCLLLALSAMALHIAGYWAVFIRAGASGWNVLIPYYNAYTLFHIAWGKGKLFWCMVAPLPLMAADFYTVLYVYVRGWGMNGWLFLSPMIGMFYWTQEIPSLFGIGLYSILPPPFLSGVLIAALAALHVVTMHKLAASFEKDFRFTLGLIFLGPVYAMKLGFGYNDYIGPM